MLVCNPEVSCRDLAALLEALAEAAHQWPVGIRWNDPRVTLPTPEGLAPRPPARGGNEQSDSPDAPEEPAVDRRPGAAASTSPQTIRVLLVDDHAAVRQAFAVALKTEAGIEVVGEAGTGPAALEQIARLRPDLVLMDINLPGMNGLDATRHIRAAFPEVQVIGLSMYESEEQAAAMRGAGARAYVSKSASLETLLTAIRAIRDPDPS